MGRLKNIASSGCAICNNCTTTICIAPVPTITSAGTKSGTTGTALSYFITGTNSPTSYAAAPTPTGITVNAGTGELFGTPSVAGVTNVVVSATNACGSGYKTVVFTITTPCLKPTMTSTTTTAGTVGTSLSFTLTATQSPTSFSATPLPAGLTLNSSTGAITGTPTTHAITNAVTSATNACGKGVESSLQFVISSATCPSPTLTCDSVSASLTKCGYSEQYGHVSTPPKIYRSRTWSGSLTQQDFDPDTGEGCTNLAGLLSTYTISFGGTCTYPRTACTVPTTGCYYNEGAGAVYECEDGMSLLVLFCSSGPCPENITSGTNTQFVGDGVCNEGNPEFKVTGSSYETLSNEYTTADLKTDCAGTLPAYPNTWTGTCSSYLNLDSDELTCSIRRFKYYLQLPNLSGYTTYNLSWNEGSTPRTYTWNGTDTSTPTYTVNEPATNGTTGVTDITVTSCA